MALCLRRSHDESNIERPKATFISLMLLVLRTTFATHVLKTQHALNLELELGTLLPLF